VDAAYKAIDSLVRVDAELLDYTVSSVTEGINALATTRRVACSFGGGQRCGAPVLAAHGAACCHGRYSSTLPSCFRRTPRADPLNPTTPAAHRVTIRPAGKMAGEGWVTDAHSRKVQRSFSGNGADEDIVVASVRAYVTALNKMISWLSSYNKGLKDAAAAEGGKQRLALGSTDQVAVAIGGKA
jgi:hypothetical protein